MGDKPTRRSSLSRTFKFATELKLNIARICADGQGSTNLKVLGGEIPVTSSDLDEERWVEALTSSPRPDSFSSLEMFTGCQAQFTSSAATISNRLTPFQSSPHWSQGKRRSAIITFVKEAI